MTEEHKGFSRRTVVKGAAWSVPVIAAAVATPLASASNAAQFDVGVASDCAGNYDIGVLTDLLDGIPAVGAVLAGTIEAALGVLGLTRIQSRAFTISAAEGTVPSGTQFNLTTPAGLIDLSLLGPVLTANALNLVTVNGNIATVALASDLTQGQTRSFNLATLPVDANVAGTTEFALVGSDNPTTAPGAANSASMSLVSVDVTLADLPGLGPVLALALGNSSLRVQLCPGQSIPIV